MVPPSSSATATLDPGSSTSRRIRHRPGAGSGILLAVKGLLQAFDLGGELSLKSGTDVGLEDQADSRAKRAHGLAGCPHDVHALLPGALDRGEHGVCVVGQATVPHDLYCRCHGLTDRTSGLGGGWGDGEGNQHVPIVGLRLISVPWPPLKTFDWNSRSCGLHGHATYAPTEPARSEEHTSELQSRQYLVCRLLLEKKT